MAHDLTHRPKQARKLVIERTHTPDESAVRRAIVILLRQAGERKDTAA